MDSITVPAGSNGGSNPDTCRYHSKLPKSGFLLDKANHVSFSPPSYLFQ